jgi:hypothetical protein
MPFSEPVAAFECLFFTNFYPGQGFAAAGGSKGFIVIILITIKQ